MLCLKVDTDLERYNSDIHRLIWIIFGRNVAERVCYETVICFPTTLNWFLCTTWGNMNPGYWAFLRKCCILLTNKPENTFKLSLVCSWTTLYYYWDILVTQQMLTVIKHAVDANFVSQWHSRIVHGAQDTVQLLQCKTVDFISPKLWPQQPRAEFRWLQYKIYGSHRHTHTHTHTHTRLTAHCPGLPGSAGTREVKPIWILQKQRDCEWQWHQLGYVQVCTSLQADNHANIPQLRFLQAGCPSCRPTNSIKALKAWSHRVVWIFVASQHC